MALPAPASIDPNMPKYLMEAIKDTFSIQASTAVKIVAVSTVVPESLKNVDIISAIGMSSTSVNGTLALCFPKAPFLAILNRMIDENHTEITAENSDASSELLNIIYGTARVKLNLAGNDFSPAIPTTTRGDSIQISHGGGKVIRLDCQCEFGEFFVEVSLRVRS